MKYRILKIIPWVILVVIVASLFIWYLMSRRVTESQISQYDVKISEAQTLLSARQYSVAITKYYEATEILPQKVEAYQGIVNILLIKDRVSDALDIIEQSATKLTSNDKSILYKQIGDYHYNRENYEEAKNIYQDGLGLGVKNMEAELMLGKALLKMGNFKDARSQFEKSGYEGDSQIEANLLISYLISVTDVEEAKSQIQTLVPSETFAPYYDELIDVLKSLDEDSKYNVAKLARIYINVGYPFLAVQILEPKEEELSEYLDGMYFLGRAYLDAKNFDRALEVFDKALVLGGLESEIYQAKAQAYVFTNDLDNALKSYPKALEYSGKDKNESLVREYVSVLLENEQYLKAEETIKNVLLTNDDAYLSLLGVEIEYRLEDKQKTEYYLSQLGNQELTEEEKKEYLYWNIRTKLDDGDTEGTDALLEELLEMDKFNPNYYLLLGKYQSLKDQMELAVQSLESAIEYDIDYLVTEEASTLLSIIK